MTFGLQMADRRRLSDIGLMSLLIVHQPTLRDAVGIVAEYRNRINSNLTLQLEEHDQVVFLREHIALNTPMICRQVSDVALGVLYKMCRSIMPEQLASAMRLLQLRTPEPWRSRDLRPAVRLSDAIRFGL